MPCFYCGKRVSIFRQINDPDFCSDEHRKRFHYLLRLSFDRLRDERPEHGAARPTGAATAPPETRNGTCISTGFPAPVQSDLPTAGPISRTVLPALITIPMSVKQPQSPRAGQIRMPRLAFAVRPAVPATARAAGLSLPPASGIPEPRSAPLAQSGAKPVFPELSRSAAELRPRAAGPIKFALEAVPAPIGHVPAAARMAATVELPRLAAAADEPDNEV